MSNTISNRRFIGFNERGVTFRRKDYRAKSRARYKSMTLSAAEFMRRFLLTCNGGTTSSPETSISESPLRKRGSF